MVGEFLEEVLKLVFVGERRLLLVLFSMRFPMVSEGSSCRAGAAAS